MSKDKFFSIMHVITSMIAFTLILFNEYIAMAIMFYVSALWYFKYLEVKR